MKLIENNIHKIIDLCKKHKVHKLFVFGSILTNRFNDKSDVDLVVDFNKKKQKITLITTLILNTLWRNYWAEKQTYWKNKPSKIHI